jgi:predicted AlkP superfamily pyrophosphatase or phosphodiesterase
VSKTLLKGKESDNQQKEVDRIKGKTIVLLISALLILATAFSFLTVTVTSVPEEAKSEYVVIIVIDGLRPDILREAETPNIDSLMAEGVYFTDARTVNLSATQVVNASLTTGSYPETHGIITEEYVDRVTWEIVELGKKPELLQGKTIFEVLSGAGMTSTVVLGKTKLSTGARGATTTLSPTIPDEVKGARYKYAIDDDVEKAFELKMEEDNIWANAGLQALEGKPDLTLIWLPNVDRAAHVYGPASDWYVKAIEHADSLVGEIIGKLQDLGIYENTAIILTADHGFTQTSPALLLSPGWTAEANTLAVLEDADIEHLALNVGGKAIWLYLKFPEDAQEAVNVLRDSGFVKEIYAGVAYENIQGVDGSLSALRVEHERSGDFLIQLGAGWSMNWPNYGQHGSIYPSCTRIPLVITGPGIKEGAVEASASIVDVAPTALYLLGVDPAGLEGQGNVLEEAVVPPLGPPGPRGERGPAGEPAPTGVLWTSFGISIIAILIAIYAVATRRR